jgi:hypothetical protein
MIHYSFTIKTVINTYAVVFLKKNLINILIYSSINFIYLIKISKYVSFGEKSIRIWSRMNV